jgi:hypothetical protein
MRNALEESSNHKQTYVIINKFSSTCPDHLLQFNQKQIILPALLNKLKRGKIIIIMQLLNMCDLRIKIPKVHGNNAQQDYKASLIEKDYTQADGPLKFIQNYNVFFS